MLPDNYTEILEQLGPLNWTSLPLFIVLSVPYVPLSQNTIKMRPECSTQSYLPGQIGSQASIQ